MSLYTVLFSSVIPASRTRQIDKTFMKGLLTIQDQEHFKTHNKRKLRQQYRKSRFSGDKTAPLAVSFHHDREFPKSARIGNSFLILLGCPFGRYDLGTTVGGSVYGHVITKFSGMGRFTKLWGSKRARGAPL